MTEELDSTELNIAYFIIICELCAIHPLHQDL